MKLECPNCRMVRAASEDRIVTSQKIAPEILEFLNIQLHELDMVATAVVEDVQKIEEELREASEQGQKFRGRE